MEVEKAQKISSNKKRRRMPFLMGYSAGREAWASVDSQHGPNGINWSSLVANCPKQLCGTIVWILDAPKMFMVKLWSLCWFYWKAGLMRGLRRSLGKCHCKGLWDSVLSSSSLAPGPSCSGLFAAYVSAILCSVSHGFKIMVRPGAFRTMGQNKSFFWISSFSHLFIKRRQSWLKQVAQNYTVVLVNIWVPQDYKQARAVVSLLIYGTAISKYIVMKLQWILLVLLASVSKQDPQHSWDWPWDLAPWYLQKHLVREDYCRQM